MKQLRANHHSVCIECRYQEEKLGSEVCNSCIEETMDDDKMLICVKPNTPVKFEVDGVTMYGVYDGELILVDILLTGGMALTEDYSVEDVSNVIIMEEVKW